MRVSKSFLLLAVVYSSFLIIGCSKQPEVEKAISSVRPAKIAIVKSANGENIKTFPATVVPSVYAHLAFRVNGEIEKIHVVAGQHVTKGQLLAELDDRDFVIQKKQANAKYNLAVSQFNRAEQLRKDNLISTSEFEQIKADLDIAESQLAFTKNNLDYTSIKAPFDGVVAKVDLEAFEFVQAKQQVMELQSRDTIDVTIQVPEQLMIKLPKSEKTSGYKPKLIFSAHPEVKYQVTLKEHDIAPNPATKSYQVVFSLPTPKNLNVLPGMTGTLEVELNKLLGSDLSELEIPVSALFIPNTAVASMNGRSGKASLSTTQSAQNKYVYKVNDENRLELLAVKVVKTRQNGIVIKSAQPGALLAGDRVIAAGAHLMQEGQQVLQWKQERGL